MREPRRLSSYAIAKFVPKFEENYKFKVFDFNILHTGTHGRRVLRISTIQITSPWAKINQEEN